MDVDIRIERRAKETRRAFGTLLLGRGRPPLSIQLNILAKPNSPQSLQHSFLSAARGTLMIPTFEVTPPRKVAHGLDDC
jgi:hypothetical protein